MLACPLMPPHVECNDTTVMQAMKKRRYPIMATIKKDGIRALRMEDIYLASRTLKWIPNAELCARALSLPIGYDTELWSPEMDYNDIQSIVMTEDANAEKIEFHVLDNFSDDRIYALRFDKCFWEIRAGRFRNARIENAKMCYTPEELFDFEALCIEQHGEGICFRTPDSPYKHGRSTLREQYLVKHCRFVYEEAEIIGFEEQMFNSNKIRRNAVGKMDRSKAISGMIPKGTLGAFLVRNKAGMEFKVGNGDKLTGAYRQFVWNQPAFFLGQQIVVKSKAHGVKNKPRSPVFWGFRNEGY